MKRMLLLGLLMLLLIGCVGVAGSANTVSLYRGSFGQDTITINKGESLTLVNDSSFTHVINNGSWVGGEAVPNVEQGAPVINLVMVDVNQTVTFGPFNTAGSFHIYCPIHSGMNLTVIVQ